MNSTAAATVGQDDTHLLHAAAIAHRLDSVLLANRVLLVSAPGSHDQICFAQGVPPSASQAAAAFAGEQDVIRQLVRGEGLPVPPWQTLRFIDDASEIDRAAAQIGYPVVVRAAWGGRQATTSPLAVVVTEAEQLAAAVSVLRESAGPRSARPNQPRGRFMVETPVADQHLRALVVDGELYAVAHEPLSQATASDEPPLALSDVHSDVRGLIGRAAKVVPDMGSAAVRLTLEDYSSPLQSQAHAVVTIDVHPGLSTYEAAAAGAGHRLAVNMLQAQVRRNGAALPAAEDEVAVTLRADGLPPPDAVSETLRECLAATGIDGTIASSAADAHQYGTLRGRPGAIAELCDLLMEGYLERVRPLWLELRHV